MEMLIVEMSRAQSAAGSTILVTMHMRDPFCDLRLFADKLVK